MPVAPPTAYPPGTTLTVGSHEVVTDQFIGEGGFAHVYTVRTSPAIPGQEIACLKRVQVPNKTYLNLLRAEVEAMQRLKGSSNIVDYYDSHAERMKQAYAPGQYEVFLLMEYCSRGGLIDFMNTRLRDQLREHEILKIMYDITLGLAHMHYLAPPLLHRDLKIENVLIRGDGTYMLCDFGSASPVLRAPKNQTEFRILEDDINHHTTVQYRSPEMIDLSRGHPIDEKSDIWALGIFLYKLCYYTTPFERPNQTLEQFQALILSGSYTIPSRPAYSERLKNMIRILLQPDPRMRPNVFQVMQEVCAMRHVECPIQDIYSRPRPVAQPTTMPGLQMIPQQQVPVQLPLVPGQPAQLPSGKVLPVIPGAHPAHAAPTAAHTVPVGPAQAPVAIPAKPASQPLQREYSSSAPLSPVSTGSQDPDTFETEDELAARYPSVEEIDRTIGLGFAAAKVPRTKPAKPSDLQAKDASPVGSAPRPARPVSGSVLAGANLAGGAGAPLIDLDSPPARPACPPRPLKEPLPQAPIGLGGPQKPLMAAVGSESSPLAGPVKPPRPAAAKTALQPPGATEYPMPSRPRSKQPSPALGSAGAAGGNGSGSGSGSGSGGSSAAAATATPGTSSAAGGNALGAASPSSGEVSSGEEEEEYSEIEDDEGLRAYNKTRMNPEATKLKQILTGIGDRPSMVIMDKPKKNKVMSSVDFLRTLGNDGAGHHHHPHMHMHSRSRKPSLFYNSASMTSTRKLHAEDEEEDDDDEDFEYSGVRLRVQQAGRGRRSEDDAGNDDAYMSSDLEDEEQARDDDAEIGELDEGFAFSEPAADPAPAQAPGAGKRAVAKPAKPLRAATDAAAVSTSPPATRHPKSEPSWDRDPPSPLTVPAKPPKPAKSATFAATTRSRANGRPRPLSMLGPGTHSTSELDSFKPSNSIQQRVRALLDYDREPPARTARGYGRFTDGLDGELKPQRSKSMGSEAREMPAVPPRDSKPKARLPHSISAQSLVKQKQ